MFDDDAGCVRTKLGGLEVFERNNTTPDAKTLSPSPSVPQPLHFPFILTCGSLSSARRRRILSGKNRAKMASCTCSLICALCVTNSASTCFHGSLVGDCVRG